MAFVPVSVTPCAEAPDRLQALTVCPDTATVYTAEFSDSLPGALGLARFMAMLRMLTGHPVALTVTAEVHHDAMKKLIAGGAPPVRFDGRLRRDPEGGESADETL